MDINSYNIVEILNKLNSYKLDRQELNFLIKKSYTISISFLKSKFKSNLYFLRDDVNSIEDIAMDSIVPLFVKNASGNLGICRAIEKWSDNLDTVDSAEYFLSRIIWRRVDQTVTNILRERDPIFTKILKSLNISIKNNEFKKLRYFGTVLVLQKSNSNIFGQIINEQHFNEIPEKYFSYKQTLLFYKLFEYLVSETTYYPAIPLNLLVKRIKNYYFNNFFHSDNFISSSEENFSLKEIVDESLFDLKEKLFHLYVTNNKLNREDALLIYSAFINISKDMINGGIKDSLYFYLKDYKSTLPRDIFYKKYHPIMNYLLTLFKARISEKINF
jgi:hypothetical protein